MLFEGIQYDAKSARLLLEKTAKSAELSENAAEDNEDIPLIEEQQPGVSDESEQPTKPVNGQLARDEEIDEAAIQKIRKSKDRKVFINGHESVMSEMELDSEDDGKYELLKPMEDIAPNG